jgi:hypothetical protein
MKSKERVSEREKEHNSIFSLCMALHKKKKHKKTPQSREEKNCAAKKNRQQLIETYAYRE